MCTSTKYNLILQFKFILQISHNNAHISHRVDYECLYNIVFL